MKRILALTLALSLLFTWGLAQGADFTGLWYCDMMGQVLTLEILPEGTYTRTLGEDVLTDAWQQQGDTLLLAQGEGEPAAFQWHPDEQTLTVVIEEGMAPMVLTRQQPAIWAPAPMRTDVLLEEFTGSWSAQKVDFLGLIMTPQEAQVNMTAAIQGDQVEMAMEMGGIFRINERGVLAEGCLTVTDSQGGSVFCLTLHEDGMLQISTPIMEGYNMGFYMTKD